MIHPCWLSAESACERPTANKRTCLWGAEYSTVSCSFYFDFDAARCGRHADSFSGRVLFSSASFASAARCVSIGSILGTRPIFAHWRPSRFQLATIRASKIKTQGRLILYRLLEDLYQLTLNDLPIRAVEGFHIQSAITS